MNDEPSALGNERSAETVTQERPDAASTFAVVGIGASAGGLEAVSQLLGALPADTGMAFVLVQHLDPKHESGLKSILAKSTSMPVHEAAHGTAVEPNNIYIIPPNTTMTIAGGVLRLEPRGESPAPHLPVDAFFKSLADDRQSASIGVVMSGTGSDGTLGLENIKAAGGLTFAQDEASAKYPGMPLAAARSGCVDAVLAPSAIASELARIGRHPYVIARDAIEIDQPSVDEASLREILELVHASFGVDFSAYRSNTIRRRIMRRMVLSGVDNLAGYARHLAESRDELDALYHDILIGVTSFFREPETFEALKRTIFPEIVKGKSSTSPLRIWVPGCSTGQEAYSLAIALLEYLDGEPSMPAISIFATDLADGSALQKARDGLYPDTIAGEVSPERLRRFFTKEDSKYRVNKTVRDMCMFAKQNVVADPPFSRVDLVSCRNLLIYMAAPLQKRIIPTFHYALNPGGFLLLGASETVGSAPELFTLVDREHRIYRKREAVVRSYPHFALRDRLPGVPQPGRSAAPEASTAEWLREADRILLGRYSPPGALINNDFHVLQFRGETDAYLKLAPGEASLNLLKMAREGLFLELRSAVAEAQSRKVEVRRKGVRVRADSTVREIDLRVLPVRLSGRSEQCFLILFEDPLARSAESADRATPSRGLGSRATRWLRRVSSAENSVPESESEDVRTLRRELGSTREYLQSLIEDQDAANEELKSANEEILSTNEELQSTNEELETAKEELQSVNEELTTVNEQLQMRNAELSRLHDDVTNLIESTSLPMLAVGVDLRLRRVTPAAAKLFNTLPTDIGRPIGNMKPAVDIPDLEAMILKVIDTVSTRERQVIDAEGRHHLLRVHPYRTAESRIDGAVLVLFDVEEVTSQAALLREKAGLLELSLDAIIVRDRDGAITFWNLGAEATYGWKAAEAIGKNSHTLLQGSVSSAGQDIDAMLRASDRWQGEITHTCRDGRRIVVESRQVVQRDSRGEVLAVLEIDRDVTETRRLIEELAAADKAKDNFIATLGHELRNPLTPLRHGVEVLRMVGSDTPEAIEARDAIERNIRRMTRLIDDLLDVSRITHGHIELRKENVDLVVLVREVVSELRAMAEAAHDKVTVELPQEPLIVDADPVRLTQIVENLLHNAIKFTEGGTIDLILGAEDDNAVLKIRDSGVGIAKEVLNRIWEPFVQGDTSLERQRGGLGLGLTLVRSLVDLHGGTVSGSSGGPDRGSEFVIRLPLGKRASPEAPSARQSGRGALKGRRVLVVDDNPDAAASFASLLKLMDNDVRMATSGPEALRTIPEFRPEIVLLDIGLPGMNGYDVARELKTDGSERPILIAVSGYGSPEDRVRSAEAGFDAHFVKPMDLRALEEFLAARAQSPQ